MNLGDFGVPNSELPLATGKDSKGEDVPVKLTDIWHKFLVRLSQLNAERPILPVIPGPSPWSYTATTIGNLSVAGGAVSARVLTRGATALPVDTTMIPMAAGDIVTITYTIAPNTAFIAGARA